MNRPLCYLALLIAALPCRAQKPEAWLEGLPPDVRREVTAALKEVAELEKLDNVDFHKAAFKFAFSGTNDWGLGLGSSDAKKFADGLTELPSPTRAQRLAALRQGYRYAYSGTNDWGLGLGSADAKNRAETWAKMTEPSRSVATHRIAFRYAFSGTNEWGQGLGGSEAAAFADKILTSPDALKT